MPQIDDPLVPAVRRRLPVGLTARRPLPVPR